VDGSDRMTIIFPDGAVKKTWLQVTVKATEATGLAAPDVHYWGNAVGDSGNSTSNTQVTVADALRVRANPRTAADNPAPIDFFVDYNRDQNVNIQDELIVRGNPTSLETDLNLIDLSGAGGAEGEGGADGWWFAVAGVPLLNPSVSQRAKPQPNWLYERSPQSLLSSAALSMIPPQWQLTVGQPLYVGRVDEERERNELVRPRVWTSEPEIGDAYDTHAVALGELLAEWEQH
jgi:hypothetical protein